MLIDDTGRDLRRMKAALDDGVAVLDAAPAVREHEVRARPLGQARRCSRSAVITIGGSGTVRSPASDFGRPILP